MRSVIWVFLGMTQPPVVSPEGFLSIIAQIFGKYNACSLFFSRNYLRESRKNADWPLAIAGKICYDGSYVNRVLHIFFGGMREMTLFVTILQLLCGLAVILAVLFQSGKSAGLSGAIGGMADTFMAKGKAKTFDAKLAKATKWIGAVFIVLTLVLNILH